MPRHDKKAYTTVLARLPQDLADQVKQYARQHRCSVSEPIRDGLEMRLESGEVPGRSTGRSADHGEEVLHKVIQGVPEVLHTLSPMLMAQIQTTIRTTLAEVLPGMTSPQPASPLGEAGITEVLPLETAPPVHEGEGLTSVFPSEGHAAPQSRNGMTEVLPHHPMERTVADEVIHEVLPLGVADDFDPQRFVLGRLCTGKHAYGTTGKSLYRLPKRVCPQCDAARARKRRARRKHAAAAREG